MSEYYIASCVFTAKFPELSLRIQDYVKKRFGLPILRCCIPKYKIREFEEAMPEGALREAWQSLPDSAAFQSGDVVYSLCHNCSNIIEEMHEGVTVKSLWELVLSDEEFIYPDHTGETVTVQDCWRSRLRTAEQDAVRAILNKMHYDVLEADSNRADTRFCGVSLLRPQPARNPKLAPKFYKDGAKGLFLPHTEEEQLALMQRYCAELPSDRVICYCHYCLDGLLLGGKDAKHIAQILF